MVNDRQQVSDDLARLTQQMRDAARELAPTQPAASGKLRERARGHGRKRSRHPHAAQLGLAAQRQVLRSGRNRASPATCKSWVNRSATRLAPWAARSTLRRTPRSTAPWTIYPVCATNSPVSADVPTASRKPADKVSGQPSGQQFQTGQLSAQRATRSGGQAGQGGQQPGQAGQAGQGGQGGQAEARRVRSATASLVRSAIRAAARAIAMQRVWRL